MFLVVVVCICFWWYSNHTKRVFVPVLAGPAWTPLALSNWNLSDRANSGVSCFWKFWVKFGFIGTCAGRKKCGHFHSPTRSRHAGACTDQFLISHLFQRKDYAVYGASILSPVQKQVAWAHLQQYCWIWRRHVATLSIQAAPNNW